MSVGILLQHFFALDALALIIHWDHSTDRKGRCWARKFPLIWETCSRSLIWVSFKCKSPSKPLKKKESGCEYSLSQDIPGTGVWDCFSFPSPPRLFSPDLPQCEQIYQDLVPQSTVPWHYVNLIVFLQYAGV